MLSKVASSTIFWVFGMTQLRIDPQSSGPLTKTLLIRPMVCLYYVLIVLIGIYIAETWSLKEEDTRKLSVFENNCLRTTVGVWINQIKMKDIRSDLGILNKIPNIMKEKGWSGLITWYAKIMPITSTMTGKNRLKWRSYMVSISLFNGISTFKGYPMPKPSS